MVEARYLCIRHLIGKVSKFQNEFMKTSFMPKYEPQISDFLPCSVSQYPTGARRDTVISKD